MTPERTITGESILSLTERQINLLSLAMSGLSYLEIAVKLKLSLETVHNYFGARCSTKYCIFEKLGVHSLREAVVKAITFMPEIFDSLRFVTDEELERCQKIDGKHARILYWLANPALDNSVSTDITIGRQVGLSPQTVKYNLNKIYKILDIKSGDKSLKCARAAVIWKAHWKKQSITDGISDPGSE